MDNQLQIIINKSGLEPAQAKPLLDTFGDFFVEAHKIVAKSKAIKVTKEDQLDLMSEARKQRLALKELRNKADKARVTLKEGYLRGGNAVQDIFNDIRDIIKPEEERLEMQEKFAELLEAERKEKKIQARLLKLSEYSENNQDDDRQIVENLSDEAFDNYFKTIKTEYDNRILAEKKAEEQQIKQEKKAAAEQEKIRKENEKLEEQLRKERKAREKLEAEAMAKEEAAQKEKAENQEKERQEELEKLRAEKEARLAPDKEKMRVVYSDIKELRGHINTAVFSSEEASHVSKDIVTSLDRILFTIAERMKNL